MGGGVTIQASGSIIGGVGVSGAPSGDYSIRVTNTAGETAYLTAGLTIDGTVNPWQIYTF